MANIFDNSRIDQNPTYRVLITLVIFICSTLFFGLYFLGLSSFYLYLALHFLIFVIIILYPLEGLLNFVLMAAIFGRFFSTNEIIPLNQDFPFLRIPPIDIWFSAIFIGVLSQRLLSNVKFRFNKLYIPLVVFILISFTNLLRMYISGADNLSYGINFAFRNYGIYPILVIAAVYLLDTKQKLTFFFNTFLTMGASILVLLFLVSLVLPGGLWLEQNPLSTQGYRTINNVMSFYLTVICVAFIAIFLATPKFLIKYYGFAVATMISSIMAFFRSLWIGLFTTFCMYLFILRNKERQRFYIFLSISSVILITIIFGYLFYYNVFQYPGVPSSFEDIYIAFSDRIETIFTTDALDTSKEGRLELLKSAYNGFLTNPLFGVGFGKYLDILPNPVLELSRYGYFEIENSLLAITAQMGILALSFFLWFWIGIIRIIFKLMNENRILFITFISWTLISIIFINLSVYLEASSTGIFFWIGSGLVIASTNVIINDGKKRST